MVDMLAIHESDAGVTFAVKVHPRAKKNAITGMLGDALKVSLTTPPVEGRANEALHRILRETFEGIAIFHYHCVRSCQQESSNSSGRPFRAAGAGPTGLIGRPNNTGKSARAIQTQEPL